MIRLRGRRMQQWPDPGCRWIGRDGQGGHVGRIPHRQDGDGQATVCVSGRGRLRFLGPRDVQGSRKLCPAGCRTFSVRRGGRAGLARLRLRREQGLQGRAGRLRLNRVSAGPTVAAGQGQRNRSGNRPRGRRRGKGWPLCPPRSPDRGRRHVWRGRGMAVRFRGGCGRRPPGHGAGSGTPGRRRGFWLRARNRWVDGPGGRRLVAGAQVGGQGANGVGQEDAGPRGHFLRSGHTGRRRGCGGFGLCGRRDGPGFGKDARGTVGCVGRFRGGLGCSVARLRGPFGGCISRQRAVLIHLSGSAQDFGRDCFGLPHPGFRCRRRMTRGRRHFTCRKLCHGAVQGGWLKFGDGLPGQLRELSRLRRQRRCRPASCIGGNGWPRHARLRPFRA